MLRAAQHDRHVRSSRRQAQRPVECADHLGPAADVRRLWAEDDASERDDLVDRDPGRMQQRRRVKGDRRPGAEADEAEAKRSFSGPSLCWTSASGWTRSGFTGHRHLVTHGPTPMSTWPGSSAIRPSRST